MKLQVACRLALLGLALGGLTLHAPPARAGAMSSLATCTGAQEVTFSWDWYEFESYVTNRPEWVGYDVMRRSVTQCTPYQRLNAQPIARTVGLSHSRQFVDATVQVGQTYEYRAIPVDANRVAVVMSFPDCEPPCVKPAWASCPAASAPLTIGRLEDWGWALHVSPCPGSCYFGFYFDGPVASDLRAQGRVGTDVSLYGTGWCCGLEGAAMDAVAWQPANCSITPARRSSWGELKVLYR